MLWSFVIMGMKFDALEFGEPPQLWNPRVDMMSRAHHNPIKHLRLWIMRWTIFFPPQSQCPPSAAPIILGRFDALDTGSELDTRQQVKFAGIQSEIFEYKGVWHKRGKFGWHWEVAERHHLLARVDCT